jgi:hypothetical protein
MGSPIAESRHRKMSVNFILPEIPVLLAQEILNAEGSPLNRRGDVASYHEEGKVFYPTLYVHCTYEALVDEDFNQQHQ